MKRHLCVKIKLPVLASYKPESVAKIDESSRRNILGFSTTFSLLNRDVENIRHYTSHKVQNTYCNLLGPQIELFSRFLKILTGLPTILPISCSYSPEGVNLSDLAKTRPTSILSKKLSIQNFQVNLL